MGIVCNLMRMKRILAVFSLFLAVVVNAQQAQKHKIAIFTPLYLDSAFDASGNFRYDKNGARFTNPGMDFYFGAQLALDSLQKKNAPLEVFVYDSKSKE